MKPILIMPVLGITLLLPVAAQDASTRPSPTARQTGQQTPAQQEAVDELNEAARSYRKGNFAEAQQHSEKALALDPSSKTAPLFIARTIHAQYKPNERSEANITKALEAIEAYKRILAADPHHEEAYKAVAYLYSDTKHTELFREWVFQRAADPTFSAEKRSEAFVVLASREWDCSFKITELPTNKITAAKGRSLKIQYRKPKDLAEFEKARQCAANGLTMIDAAIALNPDDETAWSYKTYLLMELSKLAEMSNNLQLKNNYERQVAAARSTAEWLTKRHASNPSAKP